MGVEKVTRAGGEVVWRVRWRQHGRNRARTFGTRRDARDFDAEVRRAGSLATLDAGAETFGEYVTGTWAASLADTLAGKTRLHYASLYDHHLRPYLGSIALRQITPEVIGRWQADRLASGRVLFRFLSFASLLLHEGRSVIYVARQLGHDARLTSTRYGHVIHELEDTPRTEAEGAIANARVAAHGDESAAEPGSGS